MKIKVNIDCVNIHVPRETTGNGVIDAKLKAASEPNTIRANKQRAEIARLREALNLLTAEHVEWGYKNDRLEVRRKELQQANTDLSAKLIEDAELRDKLKAFHTQQVKAQGEAHRSEIQRFQANIKKANADLARVRKERDEALDAATRPEQSTATTKKGTARKYRTKLTDEEVWRVRRLIGNGRSDIWIQRQIGIPAITVNKIRHGKTYTSVPEEPPHKPTKVHAGYGVEK